MTSIAGNPNSEGPRGSKSLASRGPEEALRCLIVQPQFSQHNYWNYTTVAEALGAKTPAAPLGLLTVAALLPQHWTFELVDLNVCELTDEQWDAADLVCVGGMLPQQAGILEIIQRANDSDKFLAVGGPDPTSQPEVYQHADAQIIGEGENVIPLWLESWRAGQPAGLFEHADRPDVTTAPIPRFDLIDFKDYVHIGVQYSRGCPFNCEFCDIIELYGRVPRSKTSEQFLAEINRLYELGYRGWVDIVDDNFVGNKRVVKPMLRDLKAWLQERKHPFFFSTEATMNLADDEEMLKLMSDVEFRYVFMGIETPDPELLALTQKRVNAMTPIVDRVNKVYDHGIAITAGFILGFDNEKTGNGRMLASCIEETGIVLAMVGLLVALPNTQLARRLQNEKRLLTPEAELAEGDEPYRLVTAGTNAEGTDQSMGLNFITTRDRVEIYEEYRGVIDTVYNANAYLDRVLSTAQRLKPRPHYRTGPRETLRDLKGLARLAWWMTRNRETRLRYWRNSFKTAFMGRGRFKYAQAAMMMYMHFARQSQHVLLQLDASIHFAKHEANYPRKLEAENSKIELPIAEPVESAS
ncbi:MAG: B12-binding domain-containing radical SAM protein [Lacipirellulaceae bacterium]